MDFSEIKRAAVQAVRNAPRFIRGLATQLEAEGERALWAADMLRAGLRIADLSPSLLLRAKQLLLEYSDAAREGRLHLEVRDGQVRFTVDPRR
jgi:hypothetical protein